MKPVVRQHYVPAGYLAGFTVQGTRDSVFFVHSLDGSPVRNGTPNSEARERHYNTIDFPGLAPDHLETLFGEKFEGPACALFKTLAAHPGRPFATEEELGTALNFFALQAARVPRSKAKYQDLILRNGQKFLEKMAYAPTFFQDVMTTALQVGVLERSIDQDFIRQGVGSKELKVVAEKSNLAVGILRLAAAILEQISSLSSTLWYADGPDWFVCSDHPAGLFYCLSGDMFVDPMALENPKVELLQDTLYLPIAVNVALALHRFSNVPAVQRVPQRMVQNS